MSIDVPRLSKSLLGASEALEAGMLKSASWWLRMAADAVEAIDPEQGHEHLGHKHEAKEAEQ